MKTIEELKQDYEYDIHYKGVTLTMSTTYGLFAPKSLDPGTKLLLHAIKIEDSSKILDLGCGYGALGLPIAKLYPHTQITMVDKDFVAIEYTKKNAKRNKITNIDTKLSNGFSEISRKEFQTYDYILSNLPAKIPSELFYIFFLESLKLLKKEGKLYIVFLKNLKPFIKRALKEIYGNYKLEDYNDKYTILSALKTNKQNENT